MWGQFTDGLNVEFGKNRVQHRGFEWNYFEEGIFEVYHYREETKSQAGHAHPERRGENAGTDVWTKPRRAHSSSGLQIGSGISAKATSA